MLNTVAYNYFQIFLVEKFTHPKILDAGGGRKFSKTEKGERRIGIEVEREKGRVRKKGGGKGVERKRIKEGGNYCETGSRERHNES